MLLWSCPCINTCFIYDALLEALHQRCNSSPSAIAAAIVDARTHRFMRAVYAAGGPLGDYTHDSATVLLAGNSSGSSAVVTTTKCARVLK